jgi:glycosyltransferase involved in cell wall biosynthesis
MKRELKLSQHNVKKVCVFTLHPTKDLRILNKQCRSLQRNGWNVTLIAVAHKRLVQNAIIGEYDDDGIKVIGVEKWSSFWGLLKTMFKITKLASKENVDLYHFHDSYLLIPALLLKLKMRKPFIYDIHEYYHIGVPCRLVPDIWPLRQIISGMIWCTETLLGSLFRNISTVCNNGRRRFEILGCRTIHTPNYASIIDFVPNPISDQEWHDRLNKVIFIGSLAPERGSLLIPEIARLVKRIRPEVKFLVTRRFFNEAQEKAMMDKLNQPEYKDVITFIPNVSGVELPKFVRGAGIALSIDQPTPLGLTSQPTKTFEYMSQGLAIVAPELPHAIAHIKNVGCGIVVKPDDPKAYADAIIYLLNNPEKLKSMGTIGQNAFKEKFNWSIVEKRLVDFYESILKNDKKILKNHKNDNDR